MASIFQHTPTSPFHLSVGAVVVNETGAILVHHAYKDKIPEKYASIFGSNTDIWYLMRETVENNESLEHAVLRGVQEEFGIEQCSIVRYLGSIQAIDDHEPTSFEKTTLYFLVTPGNVGARPIADAESHTDLEWRTPEELLTLFRTQMKNGALADLDESKIIETYVQYC